MRVLKFWKSVGEISKTLEMYASSKVLEMYESSKRLEMYESSKVLEICRGIF